MKALVKYPPYRGDVVEVKDITFEAFIVNYPRNESRFAVIPTALLFTIGDMRDIMNDPYNKSLLKNYAPNKDVNGFGDYLYSFKRNKIK